MSVFDIEKIREELSVHDPLMPCVMKALRVIARLCEEGQRLEAENEFIRKISPSTKDLMELYARFSCANFIERERLAVQLALRMPEACLCIHKLEAENAALKRELAGEMEKY